MLIISRHIEQSFIAVYNDFSATITIKSLTRRNRVKSVIMSVALSNATSYTVQIDRNSSFSLFLGDKEIEITVNRIRGFIKPTIELAVEASDDVRFHY